MGIWGDKLPFEFLRRGQVKQGLTKTRESFRTKLINLILLDQEITDEFWPRLEETLIGADVGADTTVGLVEELRARADAERANSPKRVEAMLKEELVKVLRGAGATARPDGNGSRLEAKPHVILIVGVNGSGKTTSIGKLARLYRSQKKKVLLAAADTFRAAAIDQLKIWGERAGADVIAHQPEADPGAVAFDAWQSARARGADVLIVDTAGRLQSKVNLMKELEKIARVLKKNDPTAPHETLLVLDAVTGQNALTQAREFKKTVPLTGLILAKLDGTAKGGIVFAIAKELKLPIKYIGTGEGQDDFSEFDAEEFVNDMFEG